MRSRLAGLGCLAGKIGLHARLAIVAVFVAAAIFAVMLIRLAFSATNTELVVLALAGLAGLMLVAGFRMPSDRRRNPRNCMAIAIVFDSVPAVPSVQDTLLSLGGTIIAATSLSPQLPSCPPLGPRLWQQIGIRVLGSWIAASAIMVLAMRLAA